MDSLERLTLEGMNVARLNFAHGTENEHRETVARIRATSQRLERPVAILQDLPGPKLRIGQLDGGHATLRSGDELTLCCEAASGDALNLPVPDPFLPDETQVGSPILIADGAVELEVVEIKGPAIRCRVVVGGEISSGKGINSPSSLSARPILEEKDRAALELGVELGLDFVGVSYVRTPDDIAAVRRVLRALGRPIPLIAKIETAMVLEHLEEVLARADAVMIARGDLSLEIPYERVPIEQKRIVRAAIRAGRPVITATQMLQSMVHAPRPTRAEATDVANAVLDGTDAVMLSDETAIGVNPVRACETMVRIIEETEASCPVSLESEPEGIAEELRELVAFSSAAVRTAREVGARAIVTWSRGGLAARLISRERPGVPILAPTRFEETWRKLSLPYGVRPILCRRGRLSLSQLQVELGSVKERDLLLVVGHVAGEQRRIPWLSLARIGDTEGWARDTQDRRPG